MRDQENGELLMVGFEGVRINDELRRYILRWKVGGVILFGRNIRNPDQVAELCGDLAELRRQVSDRPLLIAIDQENRIFMDHREIDPRAVRANVERALAENPEGAIVVVADKISNTGIAIQVMDGCRMAGAQNVSLAASLPQGS